MTSMLRRAIVVAWLVAGTTGVVGGQETFLSWSIQHAQAIGKTAHVKGRVGRLFDVRLLKTERAYNYKLAATWMTPNVIRASARLMQVSERFSDQATLALVAQAELPDRTIVMVEIDPREGSGVIPNDWSAFLQPIVNGKAGSPVRGGNDSKLREVRALSGVLRRNYDYDRYWISFPLRREDGSPLLTPDTSDVELTVRIYDAEGTVRWPMSLMAQ